MGINIRERMVNKMHYINISSKLVSSFNDLILSVLVVY